MNRKVFRSNAIKVLYFIYIISRWDSGDFIKERNLKGEFIFIKSDLELHKIINYLFNKYYLILDKGIDLHSDGNNNLKLSCHGYALIYNVMKYATLGWFQDWTKITVEVFCGNISTVILLILILK